MLYRLTISACVYLPHSLKTSSLHTMAAICVIMPQQFTTLSLRTGCRFYFVSDPTLLEILSLGSDPPSVVPHFQSGLFDSLSNVTFDKVDKTRMLEMFSQQGEKVGSLLMLLVTKL